jgi:hypothetical protein
MHAAIGSGVTPHAAAVLRRWGRIWIGVVVAAMLGFTIIRLATGGARLQDWETVVWPAALLALALGGVMALWFEGFGGAWLALVAVVGGVGLGAHFGPAVGAIPVVAVIPASVFFVLAWRHVRSPRAVFVYFVVLGIVLGAGGYAAYAAYDAAFGPSHPESATPAPQPSPVQWMWSGAGDTEGFSVVAAVNADGPVSLLVAEYPDGEWVQAATTTPSDHGTVRFDVAGLAAGSSYRYVIETPLGRGPEGSTATFPDGAADVTIAFSSCARRGSNGAVFDAIRAATPDLYIITGDLFYGDIGPNDQTAFRAAYDEALTRPAQAALYRSVPIAYVWDDHDFGQNDADASAPSRPAAMAAYRDLAPHYPLRGDDAPIFQAFTIGRVRVILTDTRSGRDPAGSMLGVEQLAWFEDELSRAAGEYALVVWVNPDPWIAEPEPGADHWGGFVDERQHIAELIERLRFPGFLMISGDAHMLAIDDGTHNIYSGSSPGFPIFHAGALDRPGSLKGGPYSEGAVPGGGQFGVIEVVDRGHDLHVRLTGRGWDGREIMTWSFTVPEGPA